MIPRHPLAGLAAVAMLGAGMNLGAPLQPIVAPEPPKITGRRGDISGRNENRLNKKFRQRAKAKAARYKAAKRRAGLQRRASAETSPLQQTINRMTNWQRHQWSKHCGNDRALRMDLETAERFAAMARRAA